MDALEEIARRICDEWEGKHYDLLEPKNKERFLKMAQDVIDIRRKELDNESNNTPQAS